MVLHQGRDLDGTVSAQAYGKQSVSGSCVSSDGEVGRSPHAVTARCTGSTTGRLRAAGAGRTTSPTITRFHSQRMMLGQPPASCPGDSQRLQSQPRGPCAPRTAVAALAEGLPSRPPLRGAGGGSAAVPDQTRWPVTLIPCRLPPGCEDL